MRIRTTTAAAAITAGVLLLVGCSSGSDDKPKPQSKPTHAPATSEPSPSPTFDPGKWESRISLMVDQLDETQPECQSRPSSSVCAAALKDASDLATDMDTELTDSGSDADYPATTDHLQKIINGYDEYSEAGCEGDPAADEFSSDCRVATATVTLGLATLHSKMILDR